MGSRARRQLRLVALAATVTATATSVVPSAVSADVGEDASVHLGGNGNGFGGMRMCARVSPRTRIAVGHSAELAVDTSRLYFFDPQTRDAVER